MARTHLHDPQRAIGINLGGRVRDDLFRTARYDLRRLNGGDVRHVAGGEDHVLKALPDVDRQHLPGGERVRGGDRAHHEHA